MWKHLVQPLTRADISEAIKDPDWQHFRISLYALSLEQKRLRLEQWLLDHPTKHARVQVANYVNALKRAGLVR